MLYYAVMLKYNAEETLKTSFIQPWTRLYVLLSLSDATSGNNVFCCCFFLKKKKKKIRTKFRKVQKGIQCNVYFMEIIELECFASIKL